MFIKSWQDDQVYKTIINVSDEVFKRTYHAQILDNRYFRYTFSSHFVFSINNIKSVDEADFFLLPELHEHVSELQNAQLTATLARTQLLTVLVEGTPSMTKLIDRENYVRYRQIDIVKRTLDSMNFYGWDASEEILEEMGNDLFTFIQCQKYYADLCEKQLLVQKYVKTIFPEYFAKEMNLEEEQNFLLSCSVEELQMIRSGQKMLQELKSGRDFFQKEMQKKVATKELLARTFPERTRSMVTTLEKIQKLIFLEESREKTVLTAGVAHLIRLKDRMNHAEYSLDPLYHWMKTHKVVILAPTSIKDVL